MIFFTVGTGEFPRLVKAADELAAEVSDVIIQGAIPNFEAKHAEYHVYVKDIQYYLEKAEIIVSHCGVGTVQRILACDKPAVIVPRRHKLNEHYDDHQWIMAEKMKADLPFIFVDDISELPQAIKDAPQFFKERQYKSSRPALVADLKTTIQTLIGS